MITVDQQNNLVSAVVFGEFTLADFRELEEMVRFRIKFEGELDLLFDLRQMAGFTVDVAWEDIKFTRAHAHDFRRVAVLTDSQWITWSASITQAFVDADVQVFTSSEEARIWLGSQ